MAAGTGRGRGMRACLRGVAAAAAVILLAGCAPLVEGSSVMRRSKAHELHANKTRLHRTLLQDYNRVMPPPGMTAVAVQLLLYSIVEVSTARQTIKLQGWWRHYWDDERLSWDADEWGVDTLIFSKSDIWMPDNVIYELISSEDAGEIAFTVTSDGSCYYSVPRVSTIRCKMDLDAYPYDTQACKFTMGSMLYDASTLDISPRQVAPEWFVDENDNPRQDKTGIDLLQYKANSEWALQRIRITTKLEYYECCPDPYPIVGYELVIARQTTTHITGIMVPIIAVTLVGFAVLLTPSPLSGARPGISVSVMFTTTAIYLVAARKMPDLGRLTLVGRLYVVSTMCSLVMIFISVLTTAINLVVAEKNSNRNDLLNMFRHYDSDRSGYLELPEASKALNGLGIGRKGREKLLSMAHVNEDGGISLDEWLALGEIARRLRPSTQNNLVIDALLRRLAKMMHKGEPPQLDSESIEEQFQVVRRGTVAAPETHPVRMNDIEISSNVLGSQNLSNLGAGHDSPTASGGRSQQGSRTNLSIPPRLSRMSRSESIRELTVSTESSVKMVMEWAAELGYDIEVQDRIEKEKIDVQALQMLPLAQVAELGIVRVGHQAKIIEAAKWEYQRQKRLKTCHVPHMTMEQILAKTVDPASTGHEFHAINVADTTPTALSSRNVSQPELPSPVKMERRGSFVIDQSNSKDGPHHKLLHLGAYIDFYSLLIFPSLFVLYLIIEFSGALTGYPVKFGGGGSDSVRTVIELVDERAGEEGLRMCFANYQDLGVSNIVEKCGVPSWAG